MSLVLYAVAIGLIFSAGGMGYVAWDGWRRFHGPEPALEDAGASLVLLVCGVVLLWIISL